MSPDQLVELEEERRFLLRSLTDLDREHDAGDVSDEDYDVLRDGYTARAATVLRAIEQDSITREAAPKRRWSVTAAWVVAVIVLASVSGWLVARSSGQRTPGQTMTGGQPVDEVTAKLAEARTAFMASPTDALVLYQDVLAIEPQNPEARTYLGWLLAQSSQSIEGDASTSALTAAVSLLTQVTTDTPSYPDAHCFLAVVVGRYLKPIDKDLALTQGAACMANDPTGMTSQLVGPLMEELSSTPGVTSAG